jgi:Tc toxin complex TcA C-terminal TcB-binding domain
MEKAYLDENVREYELTKQISLRLHFPAAFLQLRTMGRCEIEIPEWMFDMNFPGHYMRRIKNVSLTIPCVTGPYTGVHCRLTLLGSTTRVDPRLSTPPHECCCPKGCCDSCDDADRLAHEYATRPDDPRIVRQFGAREAVATSTGQNDAGLFTLDFNDQRYLPFEYAGAASRWRIELPRENNYFDTSTQTDCIMRLGIMSREGGPLLRRAAEAAARGRLPGDGWRLIDVRHELPDAWQRFKGRAEHDPNGRRIDLRLDRRMFPFVPDGREIVIGGMAILLGKPAHSHHHTDCGCDCEGSHGCPCPEHRECAREVVELHHGDKECSEGIRVECLANEAWPEFYFGTVKARIGPIGARHRHADAQLRFDGCEKDPEQLFLLCRYAPISTSTCGCNSYEQQSAPP